jgi:hypothetical protein
MERWFEGRLRLGDRRQHSICCGLSGQQLSLHPFLSISAPPRAFPESPDTFETKN